MLAEAAYLLDREAGASGELVVARMLATGELLTVAAEPGDRTRVEELVDRYLDLPLGLVDATVVAVAERLDVGTIATFDIRHFTVVRPRHVDAFELVP